MYIAARSAMAIAVKRRVHTRAGDKDAGIADEEVFHVVRLAELIHDGSLRIIAHAATPHRVGAVVQADAHFLAPDAAIISAALSRAAAASFTSFSPH